MSDITRRQLFRSGFAASAASVLRVPLQEAHTTQSTSSAPPGFTPAPGDSPLRQRLLMDFNWKFALGNADDPHVDFDFGKLARERTFAKSGSIEQAKASFKDSSWRTLNLPHDWAIELPFISVPPAPEQGGRPLGREFPGTSIGWYRKTFALSPSDKDRRVQLEFDGIYRDAMVFLNGHYLETNFCGYSPFVLDITDWVNLDEPNVLAVRVDATLGDGWFYEGAGIYRHVWLIKSAPVHLVEWGTYIRPEIAGTTAKIKAASEVTNSTDQPQQIQVSWQVLDHTGTAVATAHSEKLTLPPWATHTFEGETDLHNPALWSIETPTLYRALATVYANNTPLDSDHTTFGIRTVRFDPDKGFFLNDKPVKIKGTCCHQDHAGVGVALPDRIQYFRVERLKSMGSNGLRTTHNPPTPELMDATDTLGMVVMCETRMMDSSPEGLSQLERMIRRFRNHPSIILWSLGNEEPEQGTSRGQRIVSSMQRLAHELDPTRLCTVAMNNHQGTGISYVLDVQGFNYNEPRIDDVHKKLPQKPMIGTETASTVCTRGIYENDPRAGYVSAYDVNFPHWAATAQTWWSFYDEREFLAGGFAWTGFDYRGEPTPYSWPCVSSHFGIMDTCGFPKDNYFYYKSWWSGEPVLHLFPHWNWPGSKHGEEISVWCHTNLESVELFVNGASQGTQTVKRNTHVEWKVKYQPGAIEVRGSKAGKVILTTRRETTGTPSKIVLHPDRSTINADGEDVTMIAVEVQDSWGRTMPIADNDIAFTVTGPGKLLGLGNGDPSSHESDQATYRRVFNGWAQAIVQSHKQPGAITVQASSSGLQPATVTITSTPATLRPTI